MERYRPGEGEFPAPASSPKYTKPYKILSLDGGGSWALIQAKVLNDLYPGKSGHDILREFDLVAANSGGSLVLGGLVANMSLPDIEGVFLEEKYRKDVFHSKSMFSGINMARYSTEGKLRAMEKIFDEKWKGEGKFSEMNIRDIKTNLKFTADLLIVAYDYDRLRSKVFRSNQASKAAAGSGSTYNCRLVEAMNASTNAPIKYFDKPAIVQWKGDAASCDDQLPGGKSDRYWDGAVAGCNNPVLMAVTEALANGVQPADIVALSIGTGTARLPLASDFSNGEKLARDNLATAEKSPHMLGDMLKMVGTIIDDPPDSASYISHVVLANSGEQGRQPVVRMSPFIRPLIRQDGTLRAPHKLEGQFRDLCRLEMDAVKQEDVKKIVQLADNWMANDKTDVNLDAGVMNQPIRYSGRAFEKCEVGHCTYVDAKKHWLEISKKEDSKQSY